MNEEQKSKIKEVVGKAADELSDKALAAAKKQTNRLWKVLLYCVAVALAAAKKQTNRLWKVLLYCVAVALAGIAALAGFTGCEHITPEQVHAAHALYHAASGEPCIFVVEDYKK